MEVSVYNNKGEDVGRKIVLSDAVFAIEPNEHTVYLDVKHYLANKRQGTAKTKGRSEITGSTRKIKKQKGTGTARAGSIKSPIFRGGGTAFGPLPRDYGFKLNKKTKKLARKSIFSVRVKENSVRILEDFFLDTPKTKSILEILNNFLLKDKKKILFVLKKSNQNIFKSSRNLKNVSVVTAAEANTYNLINSDYVFLFEGAVEYFNTNLS